MFLYILYTLFNFIYSYEGYILKKGNIQAKYNYFEWNDKIVLIQLLVTDNLCTIDNIYLLSNIKLPIKNNEMKEIFIDCNKYKYLNA